MAGKSTQRTLEQSVRMAIHDHYCSCGDDGSDCRDDEQASIERGVLEQLKEDGHV